MKLMTVALLAWLLLAPLASGGTEKGPVQPGKRDKCPVCGMFVYKYPDFLAQIQFQDGTVSFFDGCKDMFKGYFHLRKYHPKQKEANLAAIYVTDYYNLGPIDGRQAFYVMGSDVYGPMGKELIPFEKEEEAKEFLKNHKGQRLLRFDEITYPLVKGLDQ